MHVGDAARHLHAMMGRWKMRASVSKHHNGSSRRHHDEQVRPTPTPPSPHLDEQA